LTRIDSVVRDSTKKSANRPVILYLQE